MAFQDRDIKTLQQILKRLDQLERRTFGLSTGNVSLVDLGGTTDHTALSNIGTNTHPQIDTHVGSTSNPHSVTLAQVGGTTDHTALSNIGTNTHAQLDTHAASTSNPHSVTAAQAGAQASDATLTALAGLATGANKIPYSTGTDTFSQLDFKDEDDMASNSATALASQQSIVAYISALLAIGSANALYAQVIFVGNFRSTILIPDNNFEEHNSTATSGAVDFYYDVTQIRLLGSFKLYIEEIVIYLQAADANNYLNYIILYGGSDASSTTSIATDSTTYNTTGKKTFSFTAVDCSSYDRLRVGTGGSVNTTSNGLRVRYVKIKYYYGT